MGTASTGTDAAGVRHESLRALERGDASLAEVTALAADARTAIEGIEALAGPVG